MLQVREKEGRPEVKIPRATLLLVFLNVVFYLLASGSSSFFILSSSVLNELSLQAAKPLSVFTYMFIHLWPSHLAVDCLLLLVFGWIVEREVGFSKTLLIYFMSGAVAGMFHLIVSPATKLVGSSGAVFGLVGASIVIAPVLTFVSFVLLAYGVSPVLVSGIETYGEQVGASLQTESKTISENYTDLSQSETALRQEVSSKRETVSTLGNNVSSIERQLGQLEQQRQQIGEENYTQTKAQLSAEKTKLEQNMSAEEQALAARQQELGVLAATKRQLSQELSSTEKQLSDFSIFKALRAVTGESEEVHLMGLFSGYVLLVVLEPEALGRYRGLFEFFRRKKK